MSDRHGRAGPARLGGSQRLSRLAVLPPATAGTASDAWQPLADASAVVPVTVLVAAIAVGLLYNRRDRLADRKPVQAAIDEDITAYGEELAELNPDRHDQAFPEYARAEYLRAVELFVYAATTARAKRSAEVWALTTALEEGTGCWRRSGRGSPVSHLPRAGCPASSIRDTDPRSLLRPGHRLPAASGTCRSAGPT